MVAGSERSPNRASAGISGCNSGQLPGSLGRARLLPSRATGPVLREARPPGETGAASFATPSIGSVTHGREKNKESGPLRGLTPGCANVYSTGFSNLEAPPIACAEPFPVSTDVSSQYHRQAGCQHRTQRRLDERAILPSALESFGAP